MANQIKKWIDMNDAGKQSVYIEKTGINPGELSCLLRSKSFGEKKLEKLK